MTKATNHVARVAAVVAGLGLVAMSFASLAEAQTATTTTTTTTTSASFTRDLTMGSTGADVTALQTWLIAQGFSIPAGATGYFGAQTKAALASYQAAHSISPAAGYFGPITRAAVAAAGGSTTSTSTVPGCAAGALYSSTTGQACAGSTTTTTTTTTGLTGGEADLTKFDLRSGDGQGDEGDQDVELANAKFDVENGDISVQRVELTASSTDADLDQRPWEYFDEIRVLSDGKEVGHVDASDRDNWDEGDDDVYTITISGMNAVVKEGDQAELTLEADISDSIDDSDQDQSFDLAILRDGVRAVDAAGIQQYTGDSHSDIADADTVNFGFGAEDNGDLSFRTSSDNPDATILKVDDEDTSDEYDVFAFDVRNSGDADALINDLKIGVNNTGATSTDQIIRRATLEVDGDEFDGDIGSGSDADISFDDIDTTIDADDTQTFTLKVEFNSQKNHYLSGDTISFSVDSADADAEGADSGDELSGSDISGVVNSKTHTLSLSAADISDFDWNVPSAGNLADLTFTVTADDEDFDVKQSSIVSSTSGTASTTGPVLTPVGDTSEVTGSGGNYTVLAGGEGHFRIRYTVTGANGTYSDITVSSVAGQQVPSDEQQSPTVTRNVQS